MSDAVIQLREVFCVHRTAQGDAAALQGLDLDLAAGEILCVLGPSGAGKSTLLRVIAGLQLPSAGTVRLLGRDISRLGSRDRAAIRHRHLAFLGQASDEALSGDLPIRQAVMLPLALRGIGRRRRQERADQLLDAVGLRDRACARPGELSGGERQRVALCCAITHEPAVLLADEPTGELDGESAETVYELIASLVRSAGASAIIASHDPGAAARADRAIGLRDGRVVEERTAGETRLVIARGGWLRLPTALQSEAQLRDRVEARAVSGGLLLSPAGPPATAAPRGRHTANHLPTPNGAASSPSVPSQVTLSAVTRSYRQGRTTRVVLDRFTHAFAPGRLTVVTGRSGSGKTTLLRLIAGLDRPQAGELVLDGRRLASEGAEQLAELRRRRIGFMAQDPAPVGFLSAHENVVLALRIRGWDQDKADRRATAVLDPVGLSERAAQRVTRLSAGEVQRLALARALAGAGGLLVADEPTSRLDEANAERVAALLAGAVRNERQTVICASHDPAVIAQADELLALDASTASMCPETLPH